MVIKRITNAGDIISRNEGTALAFVAVIIDADQQGLNFITFLIALGQIDAVLFFKYFDLWELNKFLEISAALLRAGDVALFSFGHLGLLGRQITFREICERPWAFLTLVTTRPSLLVLP